MSQIDEAKFNRIIKVVSSKSHRWVTGRSYGTGVPLGYEAKNEPHELAIIAKKLFEENKELKMKLQQFESREHVQQ
jgi:hypothetical protein